MNRKLLPYWITLILLLFIAANTYSQKIEHVVTELAGSNIHIFYDLTNVDANQPVFIQVFLSTNGGLSYGEVLKSVSGDVGMVMGPGKNRKIIWDVFSEVDELVSESVKFKVKADLLGSSQPGLFSNPGYMLGLSANLGNKVELSSYGFNLKVALRLKQISLGIRGDYFKSYEAVPAFLGFDNYMGFSGGLFAEYDFLKKPEYAIYPFVSIGQTKIEQQTSASLDEYSGYSTYYSIGAGFDFRLVRFLYLGAEIEYIMAQQIDIDDSSGGTVDKIIMDGIWAGITLKFIKLSGK